MRRILRGRISRLAAAVAVVVVGVGAVVGVATLGDGTSSRSTLDVRGVDGGVGFPTSAEPRGQLQSEAPVSGGGDAVAVDEVAGAEDSEFADSFGVRSAAGAGGLDPEALGGQTLPPLESSQIVKSGSLEIEVEQEGIEEAHAAALRRIAAVGGFVQGSTVSDGVARLSFRIPSDHFEEILADLRELGDVKEESVSGEDVSAEFVDIDARLRHWRAQEAVFIELMGRARSVGETIEIRRELSVIQETIEQLEGRKRFLEQRTAFSTLNVTLVESGDRVAGGDDERGILAEAWDRAWETAQRVVGGTLVVLGALVPLSVVLAVPAFLVWQAVRRRRDAQSERDAQPRTGAPMVPGSGPAS